MGVEFTDFVKVLNANRKKLTKQQYRTIKGQAKAGDLIGANKGLQKLLKGVADGKNNERNAACKC